MQQAHENGNVSAYPLQWPDGYKRTTTPKHSRFRVTSFGYARDELFYELKLFKAQNIVLSTNIPLRNDGLPYANFRKPDDAGVAVYFTLRKQQYVIACDRFREITDNVWALKRAISAIRQIERDGVTDLVERAFRGFKALPQTGSQTSNETWRSILKYSETERPAFDDVKKRYQQMMKSAHPDNGGDENAAYLLNWAMQHAKAEYEA